MGELRALMLLVDAEVEPYVRAALAAVVARDGDTLGEAIDAIPHSLAQAALELAVAIDCYVVLDLFGRAPTGAELDELAGEFVAMETWYPTSELPVAEFFRRVVTIETAGEITARDAATLTFLVGGWLLSAFLTDGRNWFEYLDDVLTRLEQGAPALEATE